VLRYGDEIGRLLLTGPDYSAYVLTFSCRRDQTVRMVTATNVTFLTVAVYLLDLAIKVVALGLVPEGRRPSPATAWLLLILLLPVIGLLAFWLIVSVMCVSRSLTMAMSQVEDHYRSLSSELTLEEWRRRPLRKHYVDNVMRLTSALQ
jgi:hypothetical protein